MATNTTGPFQIIGGASSTRNIQVTASAQDLVLPPVGIDGASAVITNEGVKTIFIAYGNNTASIDTSMPILANWSEHIAIPPGVDRISVISSSPGSMAYVTIGVGQ